MNSLEPPGSFLLLRRSVQRAVLVTLLDLLLVRIAAAQGVVSPSAFHPLSFPNDSAASVERDRAFDWRNTPSQTPTNDSMAVSAFPADPLAPPPPLSDRATPIPVTKTSLSQPTNFRIGPLKLRASANLGLVFSDNIQASSSDRQSELIVSPNLQITGRWAISSINDFSVTLGVGYSYYVVNPKLGSGLSLQIAPGTSFNFKAKVGDFSFVFYDRPTLQQAPFDDPTRPSGIFYQEFDNAAGLTVFWNLRDVGVQLGYSHVDSIPLDSGSTSDNRQDGGGDLNLESLQRTVDSLSSSVTFRLTDYTSTGINGAVSSVRYPSGRNDGITTNLGLFLDQQITSHTAARLSGGYQILSFDSGFSGGPASNSSSGNASGFYGSLAIRNRLNRFVFHTLSVGREADVSYTANSAVTNYIRDEMTLRLFHGTSVSVFGAFQYVEQSGEGGDTFTLYSMGLSASRALSTKLSASLGYNFLSRESTDDQAGRHENSSAGFGIAGAYTENRVTFNLSYAF